MLSFHFLVKLIVTAALPALVSWASVSANTLTLRLVDPVKPVSYGVKLDWAGMLKLSGSFIVSGKVREATATLSDIKVVGPSPTETKTPPFTFKLNEQFQLEA